MFTIAHEIPRRLRLVAPALRTDCRHAAALRQHLLACLGVTDVEIRRASGSVVVFHDGAPESRNGILRALGLPPTPYRASNAHCPLLQSMIEAVMQKLLAHAAQAMLSAVL